MARSLTDRPSIAAPDAATKQSRTWYRVAYAMIGAIVALGAWNATVFLPVRSALADESTHSVMAYRRWLVSPSQVVFDVRSASPQGSMADMDRLLFKSADALKESHFDVVVLAYRGSGKFLLAGDQFQTIGQTFASENPVFLMRTLTENVSDMDGGPAFGHWEGGLLGVLGRQLDDHNQFHEQWWISPASGSFDLAGEGLK